MRIVFLLSAVILGLLSARSLAQDEPPPAPPPAAPKEPTLVLRSAHFSPGVPLVESKQPIHAISIQADVNEKGDGTGKLFLNPNPPEYDEYGDLLTGNEVDQVERNSQVLPVVTLECKIEYVSKGAVRRVNAAPTERRVFLISGPKIKSTLTFATTGPGLTSGRLLVRDDDNRVKYVVEMHELKPVEGPPVPCHPGCFPAGTPVLVPGGTRPIDELRVGDVVTTISPDGHASEAAVRHLFTTTNRLFAVRTDRGVALTTDAQPFLLADGKFRRAGDLKKGDRVWRWHDGRREKAVVKEVVKTDRTERVFNLILGGSAYFVAGDFVVRGKPPAEIATPPAAAAE